MGEKPGLCPLARGNHALDGVDVVGSGSIPARAGEPQRATGAGGASGVYPRSRGGTENTKGIRRAFLGLSPLARGNRGRLRRALSCLGSIPARAGEPTTRSDWGLCPWVYPRSRGGTWAPCFKSTCHWGLSPLARGNRQTLQPAGMCRGSIPARAGEPSL